MGELFRGVFLLPFKQIRTASLPLPSAGSLWPSVPYALLLAAAPAISARRRGAWALALMVPLALGLGFAGRSPEIYQVIWNSARYLDVVAVLVGCGLLLRCAGSTGLTARKRQQVFLLVSLAAFVGLVQFPFPAPIYFCYVAPLAALALAAIVLAQPAGARPIHACVLVFYILFAILWTNRGYIHDLGRQFAMYRATTPLAVDRAGLRVPEADARIYETLVAAIRREGAGRAFYAGPDCPEVYFLSGYPNPTRFFFDFQGDLYGRPEALLRLIESQRSRILVLNRMPDFSRPPDAELLAAAARLFPDSMEIGRFRLLWGEEVP